MALGVYQVLAVMNALDTPNRSGIPSSERLGLDADAWFAALDGRAVQVGSDKCITQVLGIHESPSGLWIQVSCADDPVMNVVLVVSATTRIDDVLERLRADPPTGNPLEIIELRGPIAEGNGRNEQAVASLGRCPART
jgi:hypothetical protein